MVILHEDLVKNPDKIICELFSRLGISANNLSVAKEALQVKRISKEILVWHIYLNQEIISHLCLMMIYFRLILNKVCLIRNQIDMVVWQIRATNVLINGFVRRKYLFQRNQVIKNSESFFLDKRKDGLTYKNTSNQKVDIPMKTWLLETKFHSCIFKYLRFTKSICNYVFL